MCLSSEHVGGNVVCIWALVTDSDCQGGRILSAGRVYDRVDSVGWPSALHRHIYHSPCAAPTARPAGHLHVTGAGRRRPPVRSSTALHRQPAACWPRPGLAQRTQRGGCTSNCRPPWSAPGRTTCARSSFKSPSTASGIMRSARMPCGRWLEGSGPACARHGMARHGSNRRRLASVRL